MPPERNFSRQYVNKVGKSYMDLEFCQRTNVFLNLSVYGKEAELWQTKGTHKGSGHMDPGLTCYKCLNDFPS